MLKNLVCFLRDTIIGYLIVYIHVGCDSNVHQGVLDLAQNHISKIYGTQFHDFSEFLLRIACLAKGRQSYGIAQMKAYIVYSLESIVNSLVWNVVES